MPPVHNVAIVGAGGRIGGQIVEALVKQGKHKVTAITRPDSTSSMPAGLHDIKKADYSDHDSLVKALSGQDFLIITMGIMAAKDSQQKLVDAAKEAGIKYIMPNEWGMDVAQNEQLGNDTMLGPGHLAMREYIEKAGLTWISMACGFWYEFSLSGAEMRYGFDFKEKKVTLFNDGNIKLYTSTWPQVGRAVAKLLAREDLESFKNAAVHVYSFYISQRDMLASVLHVTGDKESDWTITTEDVQERFERGMKILQGGNWHGFAIALYSRCFFPDVVPSQEGRFDNEKLGLPQEDLDQYTKIAVGYAGKEAAAWI
ncbi:hypothetical protein LTR36_005816 [Oleoguttula mirabilis]|uniref:NmrA-like domain-containing protein n=1 Tax=Oleoguttula mirabilis TaxID=1507867 RepID=A0AAV9JE23_9PEZI|nr:hypothetical protein LTR36_005816 [Oleoguttula mirabilis]